MQEIRLEGLVGVSRVRDELKAVFEREDMVVLTYESRAVCFAVSNGFVVQASEKAMRERHSMPLPIPPKVEKPDLVLDVDLEEARAMHRVWRALNDGDCPNCHIHTPADKMIRPSDGGGVVCPKCAFAVDSEEIVELQRLFAPAMDAAMNIFRAWRERRKAVPS